MINVQLNLPAIGFKDNDKNIYVFDKTIGIISKGGQNFYKNLTIIDSKGSCYRLSNAKIKGNANFILSLRYFQPMKEMSLEFDKQDSFNLSSLQDKIFAHVSSNAKHWLVLDTLQGIKSQIYSAQSFEELIMIFR
jgi:hypothetical protein